jgi:hypothetical protein
LKYSPFGRSVNRETASDLDPIQPHGNELCDVRITTPFMVALALSKSYTTLAMISIAATYRLVSSVRLLNNKNEDGAGASYCLANLCHLQMSTRHRQQL